MLGRQHKLGERAKGGVGDVTMLKLQCELFPPLLSEGNSGGNETRFSGGSFAGAQGLLHFCA